MNAIVKWSEKFEVGIDHIDKQHKDLIKLTNDLYKACRTVTKLNKTFKNTMSQMVEYVRFHFSTEIEMLERINYPNVAVHKKQHDEMVKNILISVQDYNAGNKFVPNSFVRDLEDWIFSHIAISDRDYSVYVKDQKNKGLITDQMITGK